MEYQLHKAFILVRQRRRGEVFQGVNAHPNPPLKLSNMLKVSLQGIWSSDAIIQYEFLIWEKYFVAVWKIQISKLPQAHNWSKFFQQDRNDDSWE